MKTLTGEQIRRIASSLQRDKSQKAAHRASLSEEVLASDSVDEAISGNSMTQEELPLIF